MNFFKKESFIKKGIIAIVIVLLMNFSAPTVSRAADLSASIADFMLTLPDGVFWLLQSIFLGEGDVRIKVYSEEEKEGYFKSVVSGAASGGGTVGSIGGKVIPIVGHLAGGVVGGVIGAIGGLITRNDGTINLPNIKYTPYAIFSNNIPILNADFFGEETENTKKVFYCENLTYGRDSYSIPYYAAYSREEVEQYIKSQYEKNNNDNDSLSYNWDTEIQNYYNAPDTNRERINNLYDEWYEAGAINVHDAYKPDKEKGEKFSNVLDEIEEYYTNTTGAYNDIFLNIYPEKAPANSTLTSDSEELKKLYEQIKEENVSVTSSVSVLKPIVSKWYNILRTVAIVGLLSVLVYIGIRILINSTSAQDKAKYKTMLKDWLVGLCLLFVLHFIMSFTMTITRYIGDIFQGSDMENDSLLVRYNRM